MTRLEVALGERSYPIYIGTGLIADPAYYQPHITGSQVLVVSNETVAPLYLAQVRAALAGRQVQEVILPDGEVYKTLEVWNRIFDALLAHRFGRDCTIVALGGGVIGDMAGFAAACYQRGVAFIQVPTTLLAQVDSSVGGKTGVNHPPAKNMIGAFHQPNAVITDTETLATLPDRELSAGIAEVYKYGLIRDAAFFDWIEANMGALLARDGAALAEAIERSCRSKAEVVGGRRARVRQPRPAEPGPHLRARHRDRGRVRHLAPRRGHRRGHVHGRRPLPAPWLDRRRRRPSRIRALTLAARLPVEPAADLKAGPVPGADGGGQEGPGRAPAPGPAQGYWRGRGDRRLRPRGPAGHPGRLLSPGSNLSR